MLMNIGLTGSWDTSSHCDVFYFSHLKQKKKLNSNPTTSYKHPGIGWLGESRFEKNTFMTALSQDRVIEAWLKKAVVSGSLLLVSKKSCRFWEDRKGTIKGFIKGFRMVQVFTALWIFFCVETASIPGCKFSLYLWVSHTAFRPTGNGLVQVHGQHFKLFGAFWPKIDCLETWKVVSQLEPKDSCCFQREPWSVGVSFVKYVWSSGSGVTKVMGKRVSF